ncbi:MAG TPA: hypothetical protein H9870_00320 [Candidatus Corynebacterium avicola]|uniref:Uncharacterized protein n=1 Tax=Candidatus Corynebacterium avicola TaxID=2838527 RepID=A0A9D1UKM5_9CORY|nr:hypothetical protein [Candidatus Corynebacterium avicola]
MGFYEDIAESLDAEGIESRVNDGTLFVPVSSDLEIQFVELDELAGTALTAANVFLAMADVAEDDEEFEAALVGVVFSVEDAVATVARHVATDQVVAVIRDLVEGADTRIEDLEFIQDPDDALLVSAEIGESSELVVAFDGEASVPSAKVKFITLGEGFDDLMDQVISDVWDEGAAGEELSELERQAMFQGMVNDVAEQAEEILDLGEFTDFDQLFDVLAVAQAQAESWEELLVPLEQLWDDEDDQEDKEDEEDEEDVEASTAE